MKPKSTLLSFLALTGSSLLAISSSSAASGMWDTASPGNWTDITKWLGDAVYAFDPDSTATFGDFITADRIITAADTTHNYTISGAAILTLDRTDATKPTLNVTSFHPWLRRTLTLSSANSYTGDTTVTGGMLNLGGGTANDSLDSTVLNLGGGTLSYTRYSTLAGAGPTWRPARQPTTVSVILRLATSPWPIPAIKAPNNLFLARIERP